MQGTSSSRGQGRAGAGSDRRTADPDKMPGQYWAYGLYVLLGGPLALAVFAMGWRDARALSALVALPVANAASAADARDAGQGAIYRGTLDGPVEVTPAGQVAVTWIGVLTRTNAKGRGRYAAERCRLGAIARQLVGVDGQRWEIRAPELRAVDTEIGLGGFRLAGVRYWLGPETKTTSIPDSVLRRCHIEPEALRDKSYVWSYREVAAPPGARAEIAGCARADVVAACGAGVARGHLSTEGIPALALRLADAGFEIVALTVVIAMFFTIVGGVGATLALRAAARAAASSWQPSAGARERSP